MKGLNQLLYDLISYLTVLGDSQMRKADALLQFRAVLDLFTLKLQLLALERS